MIHAVDEVAPVLALDKLRALVFPNGSVQLVLRDQAAEQRQRYLTTGVSICRLVIEHAKQ